MYLVCGCKYVACRVEKYVCGCKGRCKYVLGSMCKKYVCGWKGSCKYVG